MKRPTDLANKIYVAQRNKLIPEAKRIASARLNKKYPGHKNLTKQAKTEEFVLAMTELAERKGLIAPGNVALFKAKHIPFSENYAA